MTPEAVKETRQSLGLTQSALAKVMGLRGPATVAEWESGKRNVSSMAERLLKAYASGYRPGDWPEGK